MSGPFIVNGVTEFNGAKCFRIENLDEGLTGIDFLKLPFALVRGSAAQAATVANALNAHQMKCDEDAVAGETCRTPPDEP